MNIQNISSMQQQKTVVSFRNNKILLTHSGRAQYTRNRIEAIEKLVRKLTAELDERIANNRSKLDLPKRIAQLNQLINNEHLKFRYSEGTYRSSY